MTEVEQRYLLSLMRDALYYTSGVRVNPGEQRAWRMQMAEAIENLEGGKTILGTPPRTLSSVGRVKT